MTDRYKLIRTLAVMGGAVFLASAIVILLLLYSDLWPKLMGCYDLFCDRDWVRGIVKSSSWAAPLIFIGIQMGQVLFAPIPGDVTGLLGGYIFGAWNGFFHSTVGLTIGSMLNFFVVVTGLCILFAIFAYIARDPLYRWMARLSKKSTRNTPFPKASFGNLKSGG